MQTMARGLVRARFVLGAPSCLARGDGSLLLLLVVCCVWCYVLCGVVVLWCGVVVWWCGGDNGVVVGMLCVVVMLLLVVDFDETNPCVVFCVLCVVC